MKKISLLLGLIAGAVSAPFSSVAFGGDVVQVTAQRSLDVAVVRTLDSGAPWYVLQELLVDSFSTQFSAGQSDPMALRVVGCNGSAAAKKLLRGECDAVFVMGEELPRALQENGFVATRAVSQIGSPVYVFYLVTRSSDPAGAALLAATFEKATSSSQFQDAVGQASAVRVVASIHEH